MRKQTWYWVTGIAVVLLILIIWAFASGRKPDSGQPEETTAQTASETTPVSGHTAMDHSSQSMPADENLAGYLDEQDTIMADMMNDMKNIPLSKNASLDFLHGMIPHHDSAVEMAKSYLKYGPSNEELIKLANDIIEQQTGEIEQMRTLIEELEAAKLENEDNEAAYLKEYNEMFDDENGHDSHMMDAHSAKTVDEAFARGMIMHHDMALDMAEDILPYTEDQKVKELAQNIIILQEKEIKQMQDILDAIQK